MGVAEPHEAALGELQEVGRQGNKAIEKKIYKIYKA